MSLIPGGTFRQGDLHDLGDSREQPVREVTIKPFALGTFEVTFEEYVRFIIATRTGWDGDRLFDFFQGDDNRPVSKVSWQDAKSYTKWLSQATGKRYRLPTESEWEYAARSGGKDDIWAGFSDKRYVNDYAVYLVPGRQLENLFDDYKGEPVGSKRPNALLGLYDMSGNVWEWVEDCWHNNYHGAPVDGSAWLENGDGDCRKRVIRGGSWNDRPKFLRSTYRGRFEADRNDPMGSIGFRLAQDLD